VISTGNTLALFGAGVLAGVAGTAGGITSLVSYPALLAVGLAPFPATLVNSVAVVTCWPGSALASQRELKGKGRWVLRWSLLAAIGGVIGATLLLSTPAGDFRKVVPFLLLIAAVALLLQPKLSAWQDRRVARQSSFVLPCGLFALSLYNGYFGAGSGVMTLALLLFTVDQDMARANALKNMLIGAGTVVAAVVFVVFGHVEWAAVVPLGIGMFIGSTIGPRVARRLPSNVLRWLVALAGLGLAVRLWVSG
jgi:hypothetical protein